MKRRLDLAAALMHNPEVLFLDEPTTGLDPTSRASVWSEVRRLNAELGMTIFLTTQYLEEADELADRVGIISRGRLVAEGPPAELKRSIARDIIVVKTEGEDATALEILRLMDVVDEVSVQDHTITVSTSDSSVALNAVVVALSKTRLRVRSLALRTPTLDDVFTELTGSHIDVSGARS
jgi:ABC-2 type transport system ATP-binding protein